MGWLNVERVVVNYDDAGNISSQTGESEELQNKLLFLRTGSQLRLEVAAGERRSFGGVIFLPNQGFHRNEGQVVDHEEDQVPVAWTRRQESVRGWTRHRRDYRITRE